jgi:flagellin
MQINHNVRAMVTQHSLFTNNNAMSKSLEKLSTGLRINRAQDDAAGLAMSEQMRTQIRGLGKAKQNSLDGQAALQIAEGGLQEITNLMQRQRELAVQAANDTLSSTERKYLDDEFQELSLEIGRIAASTDYNGKNMLSNGTVPNGPEPTADNSFGVVGKDGKTAQSYTLHVGANYGTNVGGPNSNQSALTYAGIVFNDGASKLNEFSIGKFANTSSWAGAVNFSDLSIKASGDKNVIDIYKAIDALDGAIKSISATRAKIGTFINRLEYTINNIANLEFNTQEAESRIRDTNFATETTNFTRNQIMVQSATSMLAQANALPQSVLGLLG